MEGDETESPSKCLRQENDDVLLKRLQDVVSERASLWSAFIADLLKEKKAKNWTEVPQRSQDVERDATIINYVAAQ